jgi:hypothetical protein
MEKESLRKCKVSYLKEKQFLFHKWVEEGRTQRHPEDPQRDSTYIATVALIEDIETGEMKYAEAGSVIFANM